MENGRSMAGWVEEYLRQGSAEGWSPETVRLYRSRLIPLAGFLEERGRARLADVQPADLDAFFLKLERRSIRRGTRMSWAVTVRSFFRWLGEGGRILSNPARDLTVHGDIQPPLPIPPLEEHEIQALFESLPRRNVADLRNRLHLELLYGCGLRSRESISLNVQDIDLANRTVHVAGGKGGRDRVLPMVRGVLGAMKDYLALRRTLLKGPDHGALLLSRNGKRLNERMIGAFLMSLNRSYGRRYKRIHPHLLRHSIAVHLLRGGADIRHIQEFLGHSSLETTKIYLRLVPGRLKEDYEKAMPVIDIGL